MKYANEKIGKNRGLMNEKIEIGSRNAIGEWIKVECLQNQEIMIEEMSILEDYAQYYRKRRFGRNYIGKIRNVLHNSEYLNDTNGETLCGIVIIRPEKSLSRHKMKSAAWFDANWDKLRCFITQYDVSVLKTLYF